MEEYPKYAIRKRGTNSNEYEFILYLDDHLTEFGNEFGGGKSTTQSIITNTRTIIAERYPAIKVTMVKAIIGGIWVAAMPLALEAGKAQAATPTS